MKTMNQLTTIATELVNLFDRSIDPVRHEWIDNALECGEEGVAVVFILEWAINAGVSIPETYWSELVDYYEPLKTQSALGVQRLLTQVAHGE